MPAGFLLMSELLICTDLDRTLIPNGKQPESTSAMPCLRSLVARPEVSLAFVSGRDRVLIAEAIDQYRLPLPDFVIADVGTTIYHVGAQQDWLRQADWDEQLAADWAGQDSAALAKLLGDIKTLRIQEQHKQNTHKLSYYVDLEENRDQLATTIEKMLLDAGYQARLVWSVDEMADIGLLDILPQRASKLHAIEALMAAQAFNPGSTVFCGDSGNDMEVLISAIPSVLVANSQPQVQQQAIKLAKSNDNSEQLYIAGGDWAGMNGNYSAGMLEGIAHYYPYTVDWMRLEQETS